MKILNFILYGNFFIAFCAFTQTLQTSFFLEKEKNLHNPSGIGIFHILPFFVAAATFFLYNIHKPITYFLTKQLVENQRFLKTKAFSTPLSILTVFSGLFCLYAFFQIQRATQLSLILAAVLSLAYVLPVFGRLRLRDFPYIKIFMIAFVWAFVTVILPVCEMGRAIDIRVGLMFLEKALFVFALTISFDIRDMDLDVQMQVKTIPLSIGIKKAVYLALLCLIVCIFIDIVLNKLGVYNFENIVVLDISYFASGILIYLTQKNRNDYFFYGYVDGMMFLQSIFILLI